MLGPGFSDGAVGPPTILIFFRYNHTFYLLFVFIYIICMICKYIKKGSKL